MTQHGSFPGRPRGRRARPDRDGSGWQGYGATPEDQREFPDLSPIRPRDSRPRAGQPGPGQPGQPGPGQPQGGSPYGADGYQGGGGYGADQYGAADQYGTLGRPAGGRHSSGQYGSGQPGAGQSGTDQYGAGQAPWTDQPWPGQPGPAGPGQYQSSGPFPAAPAPDQAQPARPGQPGGLLPAGPASASQPSAPQQPAPLQPPAPGQPPAGQRQGGRRSRRAAPDETPSWAEPDSIEAFSERWHRRGLDSRDERRTTRRKRRRLIVAGGLVLALVIAASVYLLEGGPGAANLGFGTFVTGFLPGELQSVPDPCTAVPASTLNTYVPGQRKEAAPPLNSGASTECTWTVDSPPTYRVLEVQNQAYSPSGLASGNGSATFAAEDAFQEAENSFTAPGPKSGQPKATVTDLSGMPGGTQTSAFQATQVFDRGGATTEVANVVVRYRNVIVTVVVDGLDQSSGGKKYGPVSMSGLTTAANTVAKEMASQIAK